MGSQEVSNSISLPASDFENWLEKEIDMLYATGKQKIIYDR